MRSVVFRTCSSLSAGEDARASIKLEFGDTGVPARALCESSRWPHRIQSSLLKSIPADSPEAGSRLSLASIRTQVSSRRVAAAIIATSTLVFPQEAGPQISVREPRGMPPVIASTSEMPVESISGLGRTSSRDAGRTAPRLSERAIYVSTAAFLSLGLRSGQV